MSEKFDQVIARADRVMAQLDNRDGAGDDGIELVRVHLLSSGVSGDTAPSSLPWFTPSARAI